MHRHSSRAAQLIFVTHGLRGVARRGAFAGYTRRTLALQRSKAIGGEGYIFADQVGGIGSCVVDTHHHGLGRFVQPYDGTLQVNHFGRAPVDALSGMENHLFSPMLVFLTSTTQLYETWLGSSKQHLT